MNARNILNALGKTDEGLLADTAAFRDARPKSGICPAGRLWQPAWCW